MADKTDYTGRIFGELAFIREVGRNNTSGNILWECQCSCGKLHVCTKSQIIRGGTKSCGCSHNIHGLSKHPAWTAHHHARDRCTKRTDAGWKYYGGRGIEFKLGTAKEFLQRMMPTWFKGATLDRKDNNGHYEYDNIRWATHKEQGRNKRSNVYITYYNVTLTLADWAKELSIDPKGFAYRVKYWGIERAITTPVIRRKSP